LRRPDLGDAFRTYLKDLDLDGFPTGPRKPATRRATPARRRKRAR